MVLKIDYTDKNKSIYRCDKCKNKLLWADVNRVVADKCTYHLCKRCYSIFKNWVTNTKRTDGGKG